MNYHSRAVLAALAALSLAACGGGAGGSSPVPSAPIPTPTATPTVAPKAAGRVAYITGANATHAASSTARRALATASPTPLPIPVVESLGDVNATEGLVSWVADATTQKALLENAVSIAVNDPLATVTQPYQTNSAAFPNSWAASVQPSKVGLLTGSATFTDSTGTTTVGFQLPVYAGLLLRCNATSVQMPASADRIGYAWSGSTYATQNDPTSADVSVSGPDCDANATTESTETLHFPHGATIAAPATADAFGETATTIARVLTVPSVPTTPTTLTPAQLPIGTVVVYNTGDGQKIKAGVVWNPPAAIELLSQPATGTTFPQ